MFTAFSNVETRWARSPSDNDQLVALTEEVRASAEAFRISELQYREGTIDILSLLTRRSSRCSPPQDTLVQTKLARLEANVSLYIALGRRLDPAGLRRGLQIPARLVATLSRLDPLARLTAASSPRR